jgi:hypothetical protein
MAFLNCREDHLTSVKSDSEAEMDDLSDTSVECERREDRTKTNSMVQLMSHIQVHTERRLMSHILYRSIQKAQVYRKNKYHE